MSDDYTVLEQSVNTSFAPYGIAQESSRGAPGTPYTTSLEAGGAGEEISIYGDGSTGLAECGASVTAGKLVTADATARIVNATGAPPWSFFTVGRALEDGTVGQVIRIEVITR
jgi:hypothetical protein